MDKLRLFVTLFFLSQLSAAVGRSLPGNENWMQIATMQIEMVQSLQVKHILNLGAYSIFPTENKVVKQMMRLDALFKLELTAGQTVKIQNQLTSTIDIGSRFTGFYSQY